MQDRIDIRDFWITKEGDLVRYEQMEGDHASNLLNYLKRTRQFVPQRLEDRVEEIQEKRNRIKNLF